MNSKLAKLSWAFVLLLGACGGSSDNSAPGSSESGSDSGPDSSYPPILDDSDGSPDAIGHPETGDTSSDGEPSDGGPITDACTVDAYFHQVCGSDNQTYDNDQMATDCAGVQIQHAGSCLCPSQRPVPGSQCPQSADSIVCYDLGCHCYAGQTWECEPTEAGAK